MYCLFCLFYFLQVNQITDVGLEFVANAVRSNSTLTCLELGYNIQSVKGLKSLLNSIIESNGTLLKVTYSRGDAPAEMGDLFEACMERNRQFRWCNVHRLIVDFVLALSPFDLPPYVLLEIFDKLPFMSSVNHKKKIDLMIAVTKSCRKIKQTHTS